MDSVLRKVEGNINKHEAAKKQTGKSVIPIQLCSKQMYVINMLKDGFSLDEVAEHFRIPQSHISFYFYRQNHDFYIKKYQDLMHHISTPMRLSDFWVNAI